MRSRPFAVLVVSVAATLGACRAPAAPPTTLSNRPTGAAARAATAHRPITDAAMTAYFAERFPAAVADGTLTLDFGSGNVAGDVIRELAALGIEDMSELARLVPADLETRGFRALKEAGDDTTTVAGLMRDLMIMHDARRYFTEAWNHTWVTTGPGDFPIPAAYGVDFDLIRELGVFDDDDP